MSLGIQTNFNFYSLINNCTASINSTNIHENFSEIFRTSDHSQKEKQLEIIKGYYNNIKSLSKKYKEVNPNEYLYFRILRKRMKNYYSLAEKIKDISLQMKYIDDSFNNKNIIDEYINFKNPVQGHGYFQIEYRKRIIKFPLKAIDIAIQTVKEINGKNPLSPLDILNISKSSYLVPFTQLLWQKLLKYQFYIKAHKNFDTHVFQVLLEYYSEGAIKAFSNALDSLKDIRNKVLVGFQNEAFRSIRLTTATDNRALCKIEKIINIYRILNVALPSNLRNKIARWALFQDEAAKNTLKNHPELKIDIEAIEKDYPSFEENRNAWLLCLEEILLKDLKGYDEFLNELGPCNIQLLFVEHYSKNCPEAFLKQVRNLLEKVDFVDIFQAIKFIKQVQLNNQSEESTHVSLSAPEGAPDTFYELVVSNDNIYFIYDCILGSGGFKVVQIAIDLNQFELHAGGITKGSSCKNDILYMNRLQTLLKEEDLSENTPNAPFVKLTTLSQTDIRSDLIMELCFCSLSSYFEQLGAVNDPEFPQKAVLDILIGCFEGFSMLEKHDIVHIDIKGGNILLTFANGRIVPKIADFGLTTTKKKLAYEEELMGTRGHMDPALNMLSQFVQYKNQIDNYIKNYINKLEKIKKAFWVFDRSGKLSQLERKIQRRNQEKLDLKVIIENLTANAKPDLWSMGTVLRKDLLRISSVESEAFMSQEAIRRLFPAAMAVQSHSLETFTYKLLQLDPTKRPSAQEALAELKLLRGTA